MARGTQARKRRNHRRKGVEAALTAAAQGGDYPLGDRDEAWSAGDATASYDLPGDAPCYMWRDSSKPADQKSSYKLPFVNEDGGKHAVWKGITAIAAALQGGRGGVQIPEADKAGVRSKVAGYYAKAREKYDDPNIKVPWGENAMPVEEMAAALAYAEVGTDEGDEYDLAVLSLIGLFTDADGDDDGDKPGEPDGDAYEGSCADCEHTASIHAGEMNDGPCGMEGCACMSFDPGDEMEKDEPKPDNSASEQSTFAKKPAGNPDDENDGEKPGDSPDDGEPDHDEDDDQSAPRRKRVASVTVNFAKAVQAAIGDMPIEDVLNVASSKAQADGKKLTFVLTDFQALTADGEPAPLFTGGSKWVATLCPEGLATEDGRIFAPQSITWRDLPLSLMGMIETQPGHDGAQVCGRIDNIWREDASGLIRGSGQFDPGEYGQMIARMVGDETLRGVSVDIAPIKVEAAKRSEVVDENGRWREVAAETPEEDDGDEAEGPSLLDILFGEDDLITVVREGVIGAATVCPFPAFADASIAIEHSLVASKQSSMVWTVTSQAGWVVTLGKKPTDDKAEAEQPEADTALTASAAGIAPVTPPADWFDDPMLEELTPLTVEEDGRLYGHLASWDVCHTGIPGVCTTAPTSETDYSYFHLKEVVCENGDRVAVGTITMNTGHAELDLGRQAATCHYDDTGVAAADVRVGEDEFGIWFSGALRPDVDEVSARRLRGAALSGDWRAVRLSDGSSNRELIGLLAVNVPGFPVPRAAALVASADDGLMVVAQIAAGMHAGPETLTVLEQRQREAESMHEEFAEAARSLEA